MGFILAIPVAEAAGLEVEALVGGGWSSGGGFGGGPVRACGRSCQICKGGCHALFVLCVFTCGSTGPFVVPCFLSCVVGYDICLGGCKNW